ncbi:uncharacterized protein LTR77_006451 [Saxophila tyrrhenica]|uniref:DUF7907 domain-containing protein n=1 Tax=Saxophila tyrrhenica TaxID=1690608 RepID=A0AAV9PBW4_9PEZI|nr:hypothetical protein LTR77_006451 [Saxophila tyrrhenica]
MYFPLLLLSTLLSTAVAIPVSNAVVKSDVFKLHVTDNSDLLRWALINSKPSKGFPKQALVELQRPASYVSIDSYLLGSKKQINEGRAQLRFMIKGASYGMVIFKSAPGEVSKVALVKGQGSARFGLGLNNKLRAHGDNNANVWYACPVNVKGTLINPNFVLFYGGTNADEYNLPNDDCEHIGLLASFS